LLRAVQIGFGISEPTSGSMPGSDILLAYVSNGAAYIEDRYATAFATPIKGKKQHIKKPKSKYQIFAMIGLSSLEKKKTTSLP
jgi:hypothetical protein